ncbi:MAG: RidA family protein [Candidatus Rokubacteria bacterium]|nr:RidA family protein [Candidatus Rokubacteria bacterium]
MGKVLVNTKDAYQTDPKGSFSQAVRVGNLIYTTGLTARDVNGKIVGKGDIRFQAKQVFENIKNILAAEGATMDDVVKRTIYMRDIKQLPEVYQVMREYFTNPSSFPACSCIQPANLADPDYLVEVEVVAAVKE